LHRQIIREIETARWKIALKEKESAKAPRLAGEVQKNLLPRHYLTIGGLEVAGKNLPSHAFRSGCRAFIGLAAGRRPHPGGDQAPSDIDLKAYADMPRPWSTVSVTR